MLWCPYLDFLLFYRIMAEEEEINSLKDIEGKERNELEMTLKSVEDAQRELCELQSTLENIFKTRAEAKKNLMKMLKIKDEEGSEDLSLEKVILFSS